MDLEAQITRTETAIATITADVQRLGSEIADHAAAGHEGQARRLQGDRTRARDELEIMGGKLVGLRQRHAAQLAAERRQVDGERATQLSHLKVALQASGEAIDAGMAELREFFAARDQLFRLVTGGRPAGRPGNRLRVGRLHIHARAAIALA